MAVDDEDMREELFGQGIGGDDDDDNCGSTRAPPLIKDCLSSRTELRKNELYRNNTELLWESQEHWADFDNSLMHWKGHFQALLLMRKDISNDSLDEHSDQAYTLRENFREANMLLGLDCMEVYEFFLTQLRRNQQMPNKSRSSSSSSTSLVESLSNVCRSYLRFAEDTFRTALNLVLEQERCQSISPATTIDRHWEKGQHLLLRGRAHHNMGRALYELAQYRETIALPERQQQREKLQAKDLLTKARREFDNAVQRAKSLRHNTLLIHGHPDAKGVSTQNIDLSWTSEAMIQSLEAHRLEALASGLYVACSWKLNRVKEAVDRYDGFFELVDSSDIMKYAGTEGVLPHEIVGVLDDMYWLAMRVAELSTQSLARITSKKGWNGMEGEKMLQIARTAMKRASSISDRLLSYVHQHSLPYDKERVATKVAISKEESEIRKWWESMKSQASKKLSDVLQNARPVDVLARGEVAGEQGTINSGSAPLTRRIFIQNGQSLQGRPLACRTRPVTKNVSDERIISDRFNSEFGSSNNAATLENTSANDTGRDRHHSMATDTYRKWGNEVLEEKDRNRCCPPLPANYVKMGISIDVMRALEKKLGNILPAKNQPVDNGW
mmetsp:Transcript_37657/g.90791  ORF Transcript_37657/g.90791 Transcript_37657/m.90791 type:complete len:612 (-) Transcript_37657:11-1846(-)